MKIINLFILFKLKMDTNQKANQNTKESKNTKESEVVPMDTTEDPQPECQGCVENQPNQEAHMSFGGCLYIEHN